MDGEAEGMLNKPAGVTLAHYAHSALRAYRARSPRRGVRALASHVAGASRVTRT